VCVATRESDTSQHDGQEGGGRSFHTRGSPRFRKEKLILRKMWKKKNSPKKKRESFFTIAIQTSSVFPAGEGREGREIA